MIIALMILALRISIARYRSLHRSASWLGFRMVEAFTRSDVGEPGGSSGPEGTAAGWKCRR